jgi:hypothetical protein
MINNATTPIVADRTFAAPVPSASIAPISCDTMYLDSHTIPIIFGTIGVILASISLVVNIAFGLLQIRALNQRNRNDIEVNKLRLCEPATAIPPPNTTITAATKQKPQAHQLSHELDRLSVPIVAVAVAVC